MSSHAADPADLLDPATRSVLTGTLTDMRPYDRYGTPNPLMEWRPLARDETTGYESFVLRIKPGGRSTPHEHTGGEEFLVLDGELVDCDGLVMRAGDFAAYAPGSRHWSHSPGGCVLLVILHGVNRRLERSELARQTRAAGV